MHRPKVFSRRYKHWNLDILTYVLFLLGSVILFNPEFNTGYFNIVPLYSLMMILMPSISYKDYYESENPRGIQYFWTTVTFFIFVIFAATFLTTYVHINPGEIWAYIAVAFFLYLKFNLTSYHSHLIAHHRFKRLGNTDPEVVENMPEEVMAKNFRNGVVLVIAMNIIDYITSWLLLSGATPIPPEETILVSAIVENFLLVITGLIYESSVVE